MMSLTTMQLIRSAVLFAPSSLHHGVVVSFPSAFVYRSLALRSLAEESPSVLPVVYGVSKERPDRAHKQSAGKGAKIALISDDDSIVQYYNEPEGYRFAAERFYAAFNFSLMVRVLLMLYVVYF